ncbi:MAG TPA: cytochrome c [Rubrivivax sp.]|nr:cytochrome c [Rubrivivax sp.]
MDPRAACEAGHLARLRGIRRSRAAFHALAIGVFALGMVMPGAVRPAQADDPQIQLGKALFKSDANPPCSTCHTLKDAEASGPIGPDLDELQPTKDQVLAVLRDGLGVMPSFAETLNQSQREAIAAYVVWATRPR